MTKKSAAIAVAILATGTIYAQIYNTNTSTANGGEWAMLTAEAAAPTSSGRYEVQPTVFTYNRSTGIVYRYYAVCGDYELGCFVSIGYLSTTDQNAYTTPKPFQDDPRLMPQ